MIELIRYPILLLLAYNIFKERQFLFLYLSICFSTSFFGLINPLALSIPGFINNYNISFLLLIIYSVIYLKIDSKNKSNKYLYFISFLFLIIFIISLINTLIIYEAIDSIKVAVYFLPFGIFYLLINNSKFTVLNNERIIKFLLKWTSVHLILYILSLLDIRILAIDYDKSQYIFGLERLYGGGFPVLSAFTYGYVLYNVFKNANIQWLAFLILHILATVLALTRMYLVIIIFITIIFIYLNQKYLLVKIKYFIIAATVLFVIYFGTFDYASILFNRFNSLSSSESLEKDASFIYRYYAAEERIEETIKRSPLIGIGFVNNFSKTYDFNYKYYFNFIHGDIYIPNIISTTGIIGFSIMTLFFIITIKKLYINRHDLVVFTTLIGLLVFLLHTFGSNNMYYYSTMIMLFSSIGLSQIKQNEKNSNNNSKLPAI